MEGRTRGDRGKEVGKVEGEGVEGEIGGERRGRRSSTVKTRKVSASINSDERGTCPYDRSIDRSILVDSSYRSSGNNEFDENYDRRQRENAILTRYARSS